MDARGLYRRIPTTSPCKPGCGDCCGPVPWTPAEWDRVKARVPPFLAVEPWASFESGQVAYTVQGTTRCPFFVNGCTVYEDRPFMCRLFGTAPDARLTCPHGCKAAKPLTLAEAGRLADLYRGCA